MTSNVLLMRAVGGMVLLPLLVNGWDRQKAFQYLEARQQEWADWKPAQKHGGPCISCHTGLPYLMARRVLGEKQARPLEKDLVNGVQARLLSDPPKTMLGNAGVDAVLSLLALSLQRRNAKEPLGEADRAGMKRLWDHQLQQGEAKGAWSWLMVNLHPVESEHSAFYGAALTEMALSAYPAEQTERVEALRGYLRREAVSQPLHNRMAWIALRSTTKEAKKAVLQDLWKAQASDGGWSAEGMGPWSTHSAAPADSGSNAYATAWAAFTAREAGVSCSDAKLQRAMDWLERHQNAATGGWTAVSMNKVYPEGSMQVKFMADMASGYATAALIGCNR